MFTERDGYSQAASLVGGNRIIGGRGLGIEIRHDSRNRILNTTITGITQLDPCSGNAVAAGRRHRAPHRKGESDTKSLGANAAIDGLRQRAYHGALQLSRARQVVAVHSPAGAHFHETRYVIDTSPGAEVKA